MWRSMQTYLVLQQVAHTVTTEFLRVKSALVHVKHVIYEDSTFLRHIYKVEETKTEIRMTSFSLATSMGPSVRRIL
jgi:hypothetical protein